MNSYAAQFVFAFVFFCFFAIHEKPEEGDGNRTPAVRGLIVTTIFHVISTKMDMMWHIAVGGV